MPPHVNVQIFNSQNQQPDRRGPHQWIWEYFKDRAFALLTRFDFWVAVTGLIVTLQVVNVFLTRALILNNHDSHAIDKECDNYDATPLEFRLFDSSLAMNTTRSSSCRDDHVTACLNYGLQLREPPISFASWKEVVERLGAKFVASWDGNSMSTAERLRDEKNSFFLLFHVAPSTETLALSVRDRIQKKMLADVEKLSTYKMVPECFEMKTSSGFHLIMAVSKEEDLRKREKSIDYCRLRLKESGWCNNHE